MDTLRTRHARPHRAAILLAGALALAAAGCGAALGTGRDGTPRPTLPSTPAPTAAPTVAPTVAPSHDPTPTPSAGSPGADPSDEPVDAIPLRVDLDVAGPARVHVDVVDRTGAVRSARSGAAVEGASAAPHTLKVENVDRRTLRLTWVDYPIDNALALFVDETASGYRLVLIQPEPTGPTDSIAFDRVLFLAFDRDVDGGNVEAFLQDGLDT